MLTLVLLGVVSATTFGLVAQPIEDQRALCVPGAHVKVVPVIRSPDADTYQTNNRGFIGTVVASPFLRESEGRMNEMCTVLKMTDAGQPIERTILLGEQFSPLLDFGPQKMQAFYYGNIFSAISAEEWAELHGYDPATVSPSADAQISTMEAATIDASAEV